MIRVPTPADYNDTTMTFRRNTNEGSLCFGEDCKATEVHKITPWGSYVVFALIILCTIASVVAIAKNDKFPYAQGIEKPVPLEACPVGERGYWLDETTTACQKETR